MSDDPLIPSPSDEKPTSEPKVRWGRGWEVLSNNDLVPDVERHPAATGLHQLAEIEFRADLVARRKARHARMLGVAGTSLTLLALALAAAAGFGSLGDVVGQRTAALIALASAVVSAVSAFVQTKNSGDALRTEAQMWRHHADDVLDGLVGIVSRTPMPASELRRHAAAALSDARDREPTRQGSQTPARRSRSE